MDVLDYGFICNNDGRFRGLGAGHRFALRFYAGTHHERILFKGPMKVYTAPRGTFDAIKTALEHLDPHAFAADLVDKLDARTKPHRCDRELRRLANRLNNITAPASAGTRSKSAT